MSLLNQSPTTEGTVLAETEPICPPAHDIAADTNPNGMDSVPPFDDRIGFSYYSFLNTYPKKVPPVYSKPSASDAHLGRSLY